jgi:hypothetical protein
MGDFNKMGGRYEACDYIAVAASQTTAVVGGLRSYLEKVTVIPATSAAGAVTIYDGSTAVFTIPTLAGTGTGTQLQVPYTVNVGARATSASTGWKITTGAAVSVVAIGKFSS